MPPNSSHNFICNLSGSPATRTASSPSACTVELEYVLFSNFWKKLYCRKPLAIITLTGSKFLRVFIKYPDLSVNPGAKASGFIAT